MSNLERIPGDLQFISYSDQGFRAIRRFSLGNSCASLCWIEDRLLCGTGQGDALFYRLNPATIPKILSINSTYSHAKLITSEKPNTSSYPISTRLTCTKINPIDIDMFTVIENNRLHIWYSDLGFDTKSLIQSGIFRGQTQVCFQANLPLVHFLLQIGLLIQYIILRLVDIINLFDYWTLASWRRQQTVRLLGKLTKLTLVQSSLLLGHLL